MSLAIKRCADVSPGQLAGLATALAAFYTNPPPAYYPTADQSGPYDPKERPFHFDLVAQVRPGATVLEVGCGSGRLGSYVENRGGTYTGIDFSEQLIRDNQRRLPRARFFTQGTPLLEKFDLVASLYTIEHVVDPPAYLEQMWAYCRPGGLLAIICPEFVDSPGFAPSVFLGRTARRFREKVLAGEFADAGLHLIDWKIRGPLWKRQARDCLPGAFWINLRPRILHGCDYAIDTDAVHLVRLLDLIWYFQRKGAKILRTSAEMAGIPLAVSRYNRYLLVQKPE